MADSTTVFAAGVQKHQAGDLTAAEQLYRDVLRLEPHHAPAMCNLGAVLVRQNRLDEAAALYAHCLTIHPGYADAHYNFGNLYRRVGRLREAIAQYQACVQVSPAHASAWFNLGLAHVGLGELGQAIAAFRKTADLEPQNPDAHSRMGDALMRAGKLQEGVQAFRKAADLRPDDPRMLNNLALALSNSGNPTEAVPLLQKAIALAPTYPDAHNTLALAYEALHRKDEATQHYHEAVRLNPDFADAWSNLGTNLTEQGRIDEAITALRKSLEIRPLAPPIASNLLLTLTYSSTFPPEELAAEHTRWASTFASETPPSPAPHDPRPDRRLKLGYISADFRSHTVAGFIEQLFRHHNREQVHLTAYANVARADATTEMLKSLADDWRPIAGVPDERVAEQIRNDHIDILIDLSGHTAGNRLLTLAHRPAPIQCTVFGYPNTTGLKAVDYRITDEVSDPPGMTESLYAEDLLRLPCLPWVYQPPGDAPDLTPLPGLDRSTITFGCLNNAAKISEACLQAWVRILKEIPSARLVLLAGQSEAGAKRLTDLLTAAGVSGDRLQMVFRLPRSEYYEAYQLFDLALDPFPYNGGVTTCDALWMGVPVLTLAGNTYVSRQGAAILTHAGLGEFVAESVDGLVALARTWAENRDVLAEIRAGLRDQLARSPVADGPAYVRHLEEALRRAWQKRIASPQAE